MKRLLDNNIRYLVNLQEAIKIIMVEFQTVEVANIMQQGQ